MAHPLGENSFRGLSDNFELDTIPKTVGIAFETALQQASYSPKMDQDLEEVLLQLHKECLGIQILAKKGFEVEQGNFASLMGPFDILPTIQSAVYEAEVSFTQSRPLLWIKLVNIHRP